MATLLAVAKLHTVYYGNNIGFSASGGEADVQVLDLRSGTDFSIVFRAYSANANGVLFSIQSPDGSYLIQNLNTSGGSFSFTAGQVGPYALIFSDPLPAQGFTAAGNMTLHETLLNEYDPLACNQAGPIESIPRAPSMIDCSHSGSGFWVTS
ncbi:MAG: hypothetical protein HY247_07015 [archaeon]|nr:MAG: hypothetical protein HY247_07015 [archaeon]